MLAAWDKPLGAERRRFKMAGVWGRMLDEDASREMRWINEGRDEMKVMIIRYFFKNRFARKDG